MNHQANRSPYFETLVCRNWTTWLLAAAGALGLNLAFFSIMPHLLHSAQARPAFDHVVSQINIIRLKQPETPVKRKTEKPPEPPPDRQKPKPPPKQPVKAKLTLPFAINPRLPAGPDTLSLPTLPAATLDTSGLGDAFSMGDLDSPLTVLARIPPVYPMHAKHRGIEGWVRVRFVVNEDGSVGRVTVVEGNPPGVFDQSVIRCVSGWRFQPGTVEGMTVKARAETTIRFKLE